MNKSKGKIERIDFKEHEQEVKRIWSGKPSKELIEKWEQQGVRTKQEKNYSPPSVQSRFNSIKKLVGYNSNLVGFCSECRNLNTHLLKQKISGAIIVTRYCEDHVPDKI